MKRTRKRLVRVLAGSGALVWALALLSACTGEPSVSTEPTEETAPDQGGVSESAGGGVVVKVDECAGVDVSPGLVAHFLFEGDTRDATGHGHDGIPEGAVSFIPEGRHGQAIFLSGRETRVTVPDDDALDTDEEFSLAAWVKPSMYPVVPGDNPAILAKWQNSPNQYSYLLNVQVGASAGVAAFSIGDIERNVDDGIGSPVHVKNPWTLPVGTFTHIAATYNRGELRLFIHGQLSAEKVSDIKRTSPVEYDHDDLILGNVYTNSSHNYGWQGAIDDVRIYDRALSPLEVACLARQ